MSDAAVNLSDWVGRERRMIGQIAPGDLARMAAVFDRDAPPAETPPGWHWASFPDTRRQSQLGEDGHPLRGDFLPPIKAPRRMFAAATMQFPRPLAAGVDTELVETIVSLEEKSGRSGALIFVNLERKLSQGGVLCSQEVQTLVYREPDPPAAPGAAPAAGPPAPAQAQWRVEVTPDPTLLFRFSAATWNSHRIHYDRPYATGVEGYPALVVHGPLIALSLLEELAKAAPDAYVESFSFRAVSPLFDNAPFHVCGALQDAGAVVWAEGPGGRLAMTGKAVLRA